MSKNSYKTIVLGSDLPALLLAYASAKAGDKTLLLCRSESRGGLSLQRDFGYWPASDAFSSTLSWIEELTETPLKSGEVSRPPVTFQKGGFQSFVGFGDKAPASVDMLRPFLDSENADLNQPLSKISAKILSSGLFDIKYNFVVEQFHFQNQSIVGASNFEGQTVNADRWIVAENIKSYFHLLPSEHYNAREQAKLHRTKLWTLVSLDLLHPTTVSTERGAHVLVGTTEDAIPCLGGFEVPETNGSQASHWIAYLDPDTEDEEASAHILREMKRQLKRAYPETGSKALLERISVEEEAGGTWNAKTDASSRWQGLDNLWILDSEHQSYPGVFGQMRQAQLITAALTAASKVFQQQEAAL